MSFLCRGYRRWVVAFLVLSAGAVLADKPDITLESQTFLSRIKVKYWGNYYGPQVAAPGSAFTTDAYGNTDKLRQNWDDNLTLGFQVTPGFRPGIGMPFNLLPVSAAGIQIKPLYIGIIDATLLQEGNLSIHTDVRFYLPIGDVAYNQDVKTGFRSSQTTLYQVPGSRWTLGCYNYIRFWMYGTQGKGFRKDVEFYVSPFANYRLTSNLLFTLWTDVLQLGHEVGTPWALRNLPIDIQPGIKWEITPAVSVNPYLNFIPAHLAWDAINMGMVVNATLL